VAYLWEMWGLEPRNYEFVLGDNRFDEVWTHDRAFAKALRKRHGAGAPTVRFVRASLTFVAPRDRKPRAEAAERSARAPASVVATAKAGMPGHVVRNAVAAAFRNTSIVDDCAGINLTTAWARAWPRRLLSRRASRKCHRTSVD